MPSTPKPKRPRSDLLEQIAQHRREHQNAPKRAAQDAFGLILDGLNALGALEDFKESVQRVKGFPTSRLIYGPKPVKGMQPTPWVGVVLWSRPAGYHGYKTLTLTGIWVYAQMGVPHFTVGTKILPFTAPFYDADAYNKLIRREFNLYYSDSPAPPPPERRVLNAPYEASKRLEHREAVIAALDACR
jgi:hypothetical protein